MNKLLRLATLFGLCLMLVFSSISTIQADDPTPVGTPAEGNDALSSGVDAAGNDMLSISVVAAPEGALAEGNDALAGSVDAAPEGAPAEGNDTLSSGVDAAGNDMLSNSIVAAPEGHASPELGPSIQLSVGAPYGEPSTSDSESSAPAELGTMYGSVSVTSVWTTGGSGGDWKSTFSPGDSIRYYGAVYNSTGGKATAYFRWSVDGPCGSIASWSGNLETGSGTWWWNLPGSIPSNACAGTYTYKLSVTYGGQTSSKSRTFTVSGGNVSVTSVWTTGGSGGDWKSTFSPGDSIRYYGAVYNSTGGKATAYFRWSVDGPCGSIASWSGNLETGSGTWWWNLPGSIPSNACAGTYTYKLSVTYGGQTSSKSRTFTVSGGNVSVTSVWTTGGSGGDWKSTFSPGDSIRYYGAVYNSTGGKATAYFRWSVDGPCGSIASWSGNLETGSGTWWWNLPGSIPSNACAGTYTYKLSVTYGGQTSSKSRTFTVSGGNVSVTSVWTTGGSGGDWKSTFSPGDSIRYYGAVYNSTGRRVTAYFRWSVNGPCGSIASWSGNLETGLGTWWWHLPGSIPSNACAGTYTYTLSVTYGGQTSSKSRTFTVQSSGVFAAPTTGYMGYGYTGNTAHRGIDIWTARVSKSGCPSCGEQTGCKPLPGNEVRAAYDGTVFAIYRVDHNDNWGAAAPWPKSIVVLEHTNVPGVQGKLYTLYIHMANDDTRESYVSNDLYVGKRVYKGVTVLGRQGNWRNRSWDDPITHLHFEVAYDCCQAGRQTVNPFQFLGFTVACGDPFPPGQ